MSSRRLLLGAYRGLVLGAMAFAGVSSAEEDVASFSVSPAEPIPAQVRTSLGFDGELTDFYGHRPELADASGSGWKPWIRSLWFAQTRQSPSGVSAWSMRREAWLRARKRTLRGASAWFSVGPSGHSGRCTSIAFHPNSPGIIYVGTAGGGVWKTTDAGDTWVPLTDDLPSIAVGALTVLPSHPEVVLLGSGESNGVSNAGGNMDVFGVGIFRSTDAGATWLPTNVSYTQSQGHGFGEIAAEPTTGVVLAGATDGLWRSTDEGATWVRTQVGGNIYDVAWKPGSTNTVYIAKGRDPWQNFTNDNGVKISTDAGFTFAVAGTGQPSGSSIGNSEVAVTQADPEVVYASYVQTGTGMMIGVYRSTDGGATWSPRDTTTNMTSSQGWYDLALGVDPDDTERLLAGGVGLYRSDTGGASYQSIPTSGGDATTPHVDFHDIVWSSGSTDEVWVANDGGIWRSTDDGSTWVSRREGIVSYQYYDICVAQDDPDDVWGGLQDNGVTGRKDTTSTWFDPKILCDGGVCNVNPANANVIYANCWPGLRYKTFNCGDFFFPIVNGIVGPSPYIAAMDEDPNLGNHLYTAANNGIYRTTTGGNLWENVASHTARWISMSPVDGAVTWTISNTSGVWHTTDDGDSWIPSPAFPGNGLETKIHAHPVDVTTAFATFGGYGVGSPHMLRTTDFGAAWSDVTGDFPDQPANTFLVDPAQTDHWYVGSDVGVWDSTDFGATWNPFGSALPNVVVTDLEIRKSARKIVAATYGRGVWELDVPLETSSPVALSESRDLMLDPPSPNPVREAAGLRFASRTAGENVTLSIYDVSGRLVSTIVDHAPTDGIIRRTAWLVDDRPNGVYFAVLQSGRQRISRKIVVTR